MKFLSLVLTFLLTLGLSGCKKDIYEGELLKKDIPLRALGSEYTILDDTMTCYFYPDGSVPLVGVDEFIDSLDGYFVASKITRTESSFSNITIYSWKSGNYSYNLNVNYGADLMSVNDMYFFNFTKPLKGANFNQHFKVVDFSYAGSNSVSFDVGKYGFDILNYKNEILVPINILNTLFLSTNVANIVYKGDEFVFVPHYVEDKYIKDIRTSTLNGTLEAEDFRIANNQGLYFTMDYFYGLKDVKNITDGFENYLKNNKDIYNNLNSLDPLANSLAYYEIFYDSLDDLHSSADIKSYFLPEADDLYELKSLPKNWEKFYSSFDINRNEYLKIFEKLEPLRFNGNTAFIKFNKFEVGFDDMIYDDEHNILPDAWKHDTFLLMKYVMDKIKEKPEIKNIVLDLTTNGGGYIAAMLNALGFLTDKNLCMTEEDSLTNFKMARYIRVDTNEDGIFDERDGYPSYSWNILVSAGTFSAANTFTSICKDMKLAKILGEKTSGGMCSLMQHILLDGTVLRLSSNDKIMGFTESEDKLLLHEIETGIEPDYLVSRDKFYDLEYLNHFLNNNYQE